jgi:hypothetical protein
MMKQYLPLLYIALLIGVLAFAAMNRRVPSEQAISISVERLRLPENYREAFELYMIVDRPDATVRFLYLRPDALLNLQAGDPLPFGTQFIIETYHAQTDAQGNLLHDTDGHLIAGDMLPNIHMMEKRADWTIEELPSPIGVIDWNFASFVAETALASDENRNDCLTCHDSAAFQRDLIFSRHVVDQYNRTDEPQYLFCNRINRGNCIP